MRLSIFGGTGRTGRIAVAAALERGDEITAFVRKPATLSSHERLHIVAGDLSDQSAVTEAVTGADAIISFLGRRRSGPDVCTEAARTILPAMATTGVRRLIVLSNYGVAESRHRSLYVGVSWLLDRAVLRDKEQMEELIRARDIKWTVVRAPILTNGPYTGRYRTGTDLRLGFTSAVSRTDVTDFMLSEAARGKYSCQSVAIT